MSTGVQDEDEAFATSRLTPGDVLGGQWRVERRLGKGGMGSVFLAHDLALDRKVAVKILAEELCDRGEWLERFEREIRLTARLEHANVVPVYGQGRHGVRPFVVMKALEGLTLSKYLKQMPGLLPPVEVRSVMRQLLSALACVHAKGLIHRDVKPSNLFVGPDGHVTLLDLGIALDVAADPLTRTGEVMGTPQYIAPEQALGRKVDHRADIFSAGVLLFELLAGERPFSDARDLLTPVQKGPTLKVRAPWVTDSLANVVERAIAREPEERFPHAEAMAEAVEAAFAEALNPAAAKQKKKGAGAGAKLAVFFAAVVLVLGVGLGVLSKKAPAPVVAETSTPAPAPAVDAPATRPAPVAEPQPPPAAEPSPPPVRAVEPAPSPAPVREVRPPKRAAARPSKKDERPGRLRVTTMFQGEPTWANLVVDGVPRGATPLALEVQAGMHKVRVERPGFKSEERKVDVAPGAQSVLKVDLRQ